MRVKAEVQARNSAIRRGTSEKRNVPKYSAGQDNPVDLRVRNYPNNQTILEHSRRNSLHNAVSHNLGAESLKDYSSLHPIVYAQDLQRQEPLLTE